MVYVELHTAQGILCIDTMGEILRNWRVLASTLFAVILIGGAYLFARGVEAPSVAEASTETALLQAIATRDSTGDGLPDWQKSLYGIPLNATTTDYFHLGMTDAEAVAKGLIVPKAIADIAVTTSTGQMTSIDPSLPPASPEGTLTDLFSKSFFTLYIAAKQASGGVELTSAQVNDLAAKAIANLSDMDVAAPDFKTARDLTVSGSGADALKAFAASAEEVFIKNKKGMIATKNELGYLQDMIQNEDTSALPHLVELAKVYRGIAAGLAALPVPAELAAGDLAFINALMRESGIVSDFARVNIDPLATMFALDQYLQLDQSLAGTFVDISNVYATVGVALPTGAPGASYLNTITDTAKRLTATQP